MNDTPDTPPIDTDTPAATKTDGAPETGKSWRPPRSAAERDTERRLRAALASQGGQAAQSIAINSVKIDLPKLNIAVPKKAYTVATPAVVANMFPPVKVAPLTGLPGPIAAPGLANGMAPIKALLDAPGFMPITATPGWGQTLSTSMPDLSTLTPALSALTEGAWKVSSVAMGLTRMNDALTAIVEKVVPTVTLANHQQVNATATALNAVNIPILKTTQEMFATAVMRPLAETISLHMAGLKTLNLYGHRVAGWTLRMARAARNAALRGEMDAVVWFAEHCLNIKGIRRFANMTNKEVLDAVIGALLDDRWDHDTPAAVFDHIVDLKEEHHKGLKPLAEIQFGGRKVGYLDAVLPGGDNTTALDVLAAETTAIDDLGVWVPGGIEDVTRRGALAAFTPDELKVCAVEGEPGFRSWAVAATEAGFDHAFGERVRRKTKRVQQRYEARAAS